MRKTNKFENLGTGTLVPQSTSPATTGKSASIARTFNHLISVIASLQEEHTRLLSEHVDHQTPINPASTQPIHSHTRKTNNDDQA